MSKRLTLPRSCTLRKQASPRGMPPSGKPSRSCMNSVRPMKTLQFSNFQRRRFSGFFDVKIDGSCESIGDLKKCISIQKDLAVIALLYRGVKLKDKRRLDKFLPHALRIGPTWLSVQTRVRPRALPGEISLNVVSFNRHTFQAHFPSLDSTILALKEAIRGYEGTSCDKIALTYEGRQLNADDSTLRECRLDAPGCNVHLVGRLLGGHRAPKFETPEVPDLPKQAGYMNFVDVENIEWMEKFPSTRMPQFGEFQGRVLTLKGSAGIELAVLIRRWLFAATGLSLFRPYKVLQPVGGGGVWEEVVRRRPPRAARGFLSPLLFIHHSSPWPRMMHRLKLVLN